MDNRGDNGLRWVKDVWNVIRSVGLCMISTALSLVFVVGCAWVLMNVFAYSFKESEKSMLERDLVAEFELGTTDFKRNALDGVYSIKPVYMIPDTQVTAPVPNPKGFGSVKKMSALKDVFAKAEEYGLIKVDELVAAKSSTPHRDGETIRYYLDETILTVTWKTVIGDEAVNFTEVVIAHPSQFRKYLTGNKFASGKRKTVSSMSKEMNAVVGMSADFYAYRSVGVVVHNGEVFRSKVSNIDNCFVDENGDLLFTKRGSITGKELESYVNDNAVRFSLSFGPILIQDGKVKGNLKKKYELGETRGYYSRAAIGQYGDLHYLLCTIDGGAHSFGYDRDGTDVAGLASIMKKLGCVNAYTLDGGQTATMTVKGKVFNKVGYGSERPVSDMIFFATALPEAKWREVSE